MTATKMQVIASFALLTALWQTTLGSSPSIYPAVSSSINHFCSTDLSEKACTTPPSTNPADSLNQIETRAHEATTNTASTENPGPNPQCPRWDGLPCVPIEKREDPGVEYSIRRECNGGWICGLVRYRFPLSTASESPHTGFTESARGHRSLFSTVHAFLRRTQQSHYFSTKLHCRDADQGWSLRPEARQRRHQQLCLNLQYDKCTSAWVRISHDDTPTLSRKQNLYQARLCIGEHSPDWLTGA